MREETRRSVGACLVLAASLAVCGCGGSIMVNAQPVRQVPQDQVLITFIRATNFGGAIDFGIWDGENLVGVLDPKAYIQYVTTPGEHLFMARAENWSYVKANLEPGRSYYILANVSVGVWKARVVLRPIKQNDHEYTQRNIDDWKAALRPIAPDPQLGAEYRAPRVEQVREAVARARSGDAKIELLDAVDFYN